MPGIALTPAARVKAYAIPIEAKCAACVDHDVACAKEPRTSPWGLAPTLRPGVAGWPSGEGGNRGGAARREAHAAGRAHQRYTRPMQE